MEYWFGCSNDFKTSCWHGKFMSDVHHFQKSFLNVAKVLTDASQKEELEMGEATVRSFGSMQFLVIWSGSATSSDRFTSPN